MIGIKNVFVAVIEFPSGAHSIPLCSLHPPQVPESRRVKPSRLLFEGLVRTSVAGMVDHDIPIDGKATLFCCGCETEMKGPGEYEDVHDLVDEMDQHWECAAKMWGVSE